MLKRNFNNWFKKINALTFKFNNTYSINDISVNAIKYKLPEAPVNDISINFSYRPKLMSFKEFINFKKRTGSSSKNLSEDKISLVLLTWMNFLKT